MPKGVIYIMTTTVSSLIKIGKTKTERFPERLLLQLPSSNKKHLIGG